MHAPTVKTILLLDDEPAVLQIAAIILRATGQWNVLEARSLQEATEQTQSNVDLVIADLCVDEHGPAAVAAQVRALYPHVPVLFMSGYPQDHLVGDGLLDHGSAFLAKPFSPELLLRCVRNIMVAEITGPCRFRAAS